MSALARITAEWSGFPGAPGFTNLYFRDFNATQPTTGLPSTEDAAAAAVRVRAFFDTLKGLLPSTCRIQVQSEVGIIEDTNGDLVELRNIAQPAVVVGTGATSYAAPNGAVINWRTAGIRNGRRIRGRTFIVPMLSNNYGTDGQIIAGTRTTLSNAAAALADSTGTPDLHIWARPTSSGATDGTSSVVTSSNVPSIVAVLRSRRD